MYFKLDKFLVVGISKSGIGSAELLLKIGAVCYIYDDSDSETVQKAKTALIEKGAIDVKRGESESVMDKIDVVVLSPGIAIDNEIPVEARKLGKRIIGELELGFGFCRSPFVAVTGTNGKTTTCTMINDILEFAGMNPVLCGNIGTPVTTVIDKLQENSIAVAEVSSFQLETVCHFQPHIAVILNITPDHLSRHYNMENYIFVKSKILSNLRESEFAVLGYDDPNVKKLAEKTKGKIIYFSAKTEVDGAYLSGDKIYFRGKYIADVSSLPISGEHNILNALAAVACAELLGVDETQIAESLKNFKGVKHRVQFIRAFGGVDYYNDSKATNVDATVKAIEMMTKPTVLIMGGKDKGLSFSELFAKIKKSGIIVHAVLTGETRSRLAESAAEAGYDNITVTGDFEMAVKIASMIAKEGENVLLSPACSSFDQFNNFEERGDKFIKLVESL